MPYFKIKNLCTILENLKKFYFGIYSEVFIVKKYKIYVICNVVTILKNWFFLAKIPMS